MEIKSPDHLETLGVYLSGEILPLIDSWIRAEIQTADGAKYVCKANTLRLRCFAQNIFCVSCGLMGEIFLLQKIRNSNEGPHLNFYGIDHDDELVLMTKDHIIPRSRGGPDTMQNLQTMCYFCNQAKGNEVSP